MIQVSSTHQVETIVPFSAGDGLKLNLINVKNPANVSRGPVIVVHGAGVRANIFRAPVENTIVDALIEQGYDVWLENWRASIDFDSRFWTLDQAALYDHPYAVKKIIEITGATEVKALIHCQGSTSFTMSAVAGLVPQVSTIVSNGVSLHPVVPPWSKFKLSFMLPLVGLITDYLNPQWGIAAPTMAANLINSLVRLTHHECDNPVCKQVSFTYGSGCPALWLHENLNHETHYWLNQEFAAVPLCFFKQITQCIKWGNLVAIEGFPALPKDFARARPKTTARFAFIAGEDNRCFLAESQKRSYRYFSSITADFHSLHIFPKYAHLDVFMGKNAAKDTFPIIIDELNKGTFH
ncbi:hypothetical protein [uncultured Paraglaciecola sp.]|uniref:hypothetical protein n=1 Tax=uncultured Paraglaciecola sp. TaxID=1765024 RepID=UPI002605AE30|nr:hypothetical protein [uncultured Paraglaciecola sp.]